MTQVQSKPKYRGRKVWEVEIKTDYGNKTIYVVEDKEPSTTAIKVVLEELYKYELRSRKWPVSGMCNDPVQETKRLLLQSEFMNTKVNVSKGNYNIKFVDIYGE